MYCIKQYITVETIICVCFYCVTKSDKINGLEYARSKHFFVCLFVPVARSGILVSAFQGRLHHQHYLRARREFLPDLLAFLYPVKHAILLLFFCLA